MDTEGGVGKEWRQVVHSMEEPMETKRPWGLTFSFQAANPQIQGFSVVWRDVATEQCNQSMLDQVGSDKVLYP